MWWLSFGAVLLLGVVGLLVPQLSRRTVPLGVDVPSSYAEHPVVRDAIGRYRVGVAGLTLVVLLALGGAVGFGAGQGVASSLTLVAVLTMVVGLTVVMRTASAPIRRAKREQDWYAGKPVAIVTSVTGQPDPAGRVRWGWHVAALLVLFGLGAYAVVGYGSFVDPMATHSGWSGPDQWAPKSWPVVLTPLAIGLGVVLAVAAVAVVVARQAPRILPGGDLAAARTGSSRRAALSQRLVGVVNLLTAMTLGAHALVTWHGATAYERPLLIATILIPVLVVAGSLVGLSRARSAGAGVADSAGPTSPGPDSPDQDSRWKLGAFYYAPDDPRLMVEKRTGLGLTINFGRPVGKAFAVVIVALLVVGIVAPLLTH